MNTQGGAPKLLTQEVALDQLTWSRDDRKVVFAKPGADLPTLASVNISDGRVETFGPAGSVTPAWSPTDEVLAYVEATMVPAPSPSTEKTASRLFLKFADSNGAALYPNMPRRPFSNPLTAWSPDGRQLAVLAVPGYGPAEIWIAEPTAREPLKKVTDLPPTVQPRGITWTKEGDRLIIANQEYNGDIVMYELNR
jgi:Tol biopolymer transport system component